jgi:hypothetical protein
MMKCKDPCRRQLSTYWLNHSGALGHEMAQEGREELLQGQNANWLNASVIRCIMNEGINHSCRTGE